MNPPTRYDVLKDILVPVLSPLVAALAIIIAIFRESRKIRQNQEKKFFAATSALYRDLDWAWQQYKVRAGELHLKQPTPAERINEIREAWRRVFRRMFEDPAALEGFYQRYLQSSRSNPLLLLSEAKVKLEQVQADGTGLEDPVILFALHNLLWVCESDKTKLAEHRSTMDVIVQRNPDPELLRTLEIDRSPSRGRKIWRRLTSA